MTIKFTVLIFIMLTMFLVGGLLIFNFYSKMRASEKATQTLRVRELQKELVQKSRALDDALLDKEKEMTQAYVEKNFTDIKTLVLNELAHLEEIHSKNGLTPEEQEHKKTLLAQLQEIEEKIALKIQNIDHDHE